jgi:hypothetical protein
VGTIDLRPAPRPWWDDLRIRAAARRRQTNAERRLNRAGSDMQKGLRALCRDVTTAAIVAGSKLADGAAAPSTPPWPARSTATSRRSADPAAFPTRSSVLPTTAWRFAS